MNSSVGGAGSGGHSCNGGTGGGSGFSGPCGACKFLRRKCVTGCIFAPYFDKDRGVAHFTAVHKVFGASNMSKLLNEIPENKRSDAVISVCYEALARLRDPVYGCVSQILALQQQIVNLQSKLNYMQNHLAAMEQQLQLPFPAQPQIPMPGAVSDLLPPSNIQGNADMSFFFDEQSTQQLQHLHQQQYVSIAADTGSEDAGAGSGTGDTVHLDALATELLNGNGWVTGPAEPSPPRTHQ